MATLDTKTKLSTLWIIVMLNMIFADVLSLYIPATTEELASFVGNTSIAIAMLLGAVVIQVPIFMIFFSRVLKYKTNRLVNIIAGIITIVFVIGGASTMPHYIFIATIEILIVLFIMWIAWKWRGPDVGTHYD